jgi:hypothetical protein
MLELTTSLIADALKASDVYVPATLALAAVFATVAQQLEINLPSGVEEDDSESPTEESSTEEEPVAVVEVEPVAVVEEEPVAVMEEEAATEPEEEDAATEEPEASEPPKEDEEECAHEEKRKTFQKVRSLAKTLYAPWLGMVSNRFVK